MRRECRLSTRPVVIRTGDEWQAERCCLTSRFRPQKLSLAPLAHQKETTFSPLFPSIYFDLF